MLRVTSSGISGDLHTVCRSSGTPEESLTMEMYNKYPVITLSRRHGGCFQELSYNIDDTGTQAVLLRSWLLQTGFPVSGTELNKNWYRVPNTDCGINRQIADFGWQNCSINIFLISSYFDSHFVLILTPQSKQHLQPICSWCLFASPILPAKIFVVHNLQEEKCRWSTSKYMHLCQNYFNVSIVCSCLCRLPVSRLYLLFVRSVGSVIRVALKFTNHSSNLSLPFLLVVSFQSRLFPQTFLDAVVDSSTCVAQYHNLTVALC